MSEVHFFNANAMEWTGHERFPDVRFKALETRATHPHASVMLVRLAVAGDITPHTHEKETETVYVLAGQAWLTYGDEQTLIEPGTGASIPPGIQHSVHNTGEIPLEMVAIHMPPIR
jgi:mannose-6-phosphate isomerase-like protein (cupin superfamily)